MAVARFRDGAEAKRFLRQMRWLLNRQESRGQKPNLLNDITARQMLARVGGQKMPKVTLIVPKKYSRSGIRVT